MGERRERSHRPGSHRLCRTAGGGGASKSQRPSFFVRGKKSFASIWADGHHDNKFPHLWLAAPPGAQRELVGSEPEHFFVPPYVGHRGWVGVRLDRDIAPDELAELCQDAYRAVAPASLVRRLDDSS